MRPVAWLLVIAVGACGGGESTGPPTTTDALTPTSTTGIEVGPGQGTTTTSGIGAGTACPADRICEIEVPLREVPLEGEGISLTGGEEDRALVVTKGRISQVDLASGTVVDTVDIPEDGLEVAPDGDGFWLVANEFGGGRLLRLAADGSITAEVEIEVIGGPRSLAVGEGAVWTVVDGNGRVARVDPSDNTATVIEGASETVAGNIETPIAIGHGSVWASDASRGAVQIIDPTSVSITDVVEDLGYLASTDGDTTTIYAWGAIGLQAGEAGMWVLSQTAHEEEGSQVQRGAVFLLDPVGSIVRRTDLKVSPVYARPALAVTEGAAWYIGPDGHLLRADLASGRQVMIRTPGFGFLATGVIASVGRIHFLTDGGFEGRATLVSADLAEIEGAVAALG